MSARRRLATDAFNAGVRNDLDLIDEPEPSESSAVGPEAPIERPEMAAAGPIRTVPARAPSELYDACLPLVKGQGRPSWGQLVVWTCLDRPQEVQAATQARLQTRLGFRVRRGQNIDGAAITQVGCRVTPAELAILDDLRDRCEGATRTDVIIAALTVAREHPADYA